MIHKNFPRLSFCCVLLLCSLGCEEYEYAISMKPQGNQLTRTLTCSDSVPSEELERITQLYEERTSKTGFTGNFEGRLPKDIGEYGIYEYHNDPMGDAYAYIERFRGNNNPAADVEDMFAVADRSIDLLLDWFEFELGQDKNFGKLRLFLDAKVRADLKNVCMYYWLGSRLITDEETPDDEWPMRMFLYLVEQEYVSLDQLFLMEEDPDTILPRIQNLLSQKLGYTNADNFCSVNVPCLR